MLLDRRARVFILTLQCLLSVWLFFGSLELAEESQFVAETGTEDQSGQDLDEEVLSQLASGLKSDQSLLPRENASVIIAFPEPAISVPFATLDQSTHQKRPPSLPLYQQFSVYRI